MAAVLALQQAFKTKTQFRKGKWPPFWPCNRLSKPKSSFGKQNGRRFGLATGFQNQNPVLESKMAAVLALQHSFKTKIQTKIQFWKAKWPPFWPCNRLSKPKSSFGKQNGRRFGLSTGFQNQNPVLESKMAAVLALQHSFKTKIQTKIQFWKAKWPPFWPFNRISKPKSSFGKQNGRRFGLSTGFQNQNPVLESKMAAVLAFQQAFKTKIQFWKAKWQPFWPFNRLSKPISTFG